MEWCLKFISILIHLNFNRFLTPSDSLAQKSKAGSWFWARARAAVARGCKMGLLGPCGMGIMLLMIVMLWFILWIFMIMFVSSPVSSSFVPMTIQKRLNHSYCTHVPRISSHPSRHQKVFQLSWGFLSPVRGRGHRCSSGHSPSQALGWPDCFRTEECWNVAGACEPYSWWGE